MAAYENKAARVLVVLCEKIEELWLESLPVSAILEATFRIELPQQMETEAKNQLRSSLRTKIVDVFYQRINQPVQIATRQVRIQFTQVYEGAKHFYTIDTHNDAVKHAMMKLVVDEINTRWVASIAAYGAIEENHVPPGTRVSVNFLLSRPLDHFHI